MEEVATAKEMATTKEMVTANEAAVTENHGGGG